MLSFAMLLKGAGVELSAVRLLRHQEAPAPGLPAPYVLWRDQRAAFDVYQSVQSGRNQGRLAAAHWASFVGTPDGRTMFVGLSAATLVGPLASDVRCPVKGIALSGDAYDRYQLTLLPALSDCIGRLFIEWGGGTRTWIQRADSDPKRIVEVRREFEEDAFPGFQSFMISLSQLDTLPLGWIAALSSARGVYLLTCPKTREQYVGSASGAGGFVTRWRMYFANQHGGNVALKSRDPSDYQVSILDTVGSSATLDEVLRLEILWKNKLQSREMGLNRN